MLGKRIIKAIEERAFGRSKTATPKDAASNFDKKASGTLANGSEILKDELSRNFAGSKLMSKRELDLEIDPKSLTSIRPRKQS